MTDTVLVPINPYAAAEAAEKYFHYVVVDEYGTFGFTPRSRPDCPLCIKDYPDVACVSGSGDSLCGSYAGHVADYVVRCCK